jgi:hypothetical protein
MSWTTVIRPLEFTQGQTYEKEWTFAQGGTPIALTGATAAAQIRNKAGTLLADLTTANGGVVITAAQGKVKIVMTPAITGAVTETDEDPHSWDIEITMGTTVEKPFRGPVIVHKRTTGAS